MYTICLHKIPFFAPVGVYEEEKKIGTSLLLDLSVTLNEQYGNSDNFSVNFVDYQLIYERIAVIMTRPHDLLERLAAEITDMLFEMSQDIAQVDITIKKKNPPIHSFMGSISVNYTRSKPA